MMQLWLYSKKKKKSFLTLTFFLSVCDLNLVIATLYHFKIILGEINLTIVNLSHIVTSLSQSGFKSHNFDFNLAVVTIFRIIT